MVEGQFIIRSRILCPECSATANLEVKCCSHGFFAAKCTDCGRVRQVNDPPYDCLGSLPPEVNNGTP